MDRKGEDMRKSIIILLILFSIFLSNMGGATERTPKEKKKQPKQFVESLYLEKQKKFMASLSKGSVGRFQAVRIDSHCVFVLDTKEGYLWVWIIQLDEGGKSAEFLTYQGQVSLGTEMGGLISRTYRK